MELEQDKIPTSFASFAKKYFAAPSSSVYSERLFSEVGNLYDKKVIDCYPRPAKNIYFSLQLEKNKNSLI